MSIEDHYPTPCQFCKISAAYEPSSTSPIPNDPDPEKLSPQCHLILSTPQVLAFLDIMPIAPGHILLTTRKHYQKLSDLLPASPATSTWTSHREAAEAREASRALGEWMPILSRALCKATGVEDWNVVQNNGERAAQVVPHVHFHLIPRYQDGKEDVGRMKSWTMFGRGRRTDLDDDEAREISRQLREAVREEVEGKVQEKQRGKL